MEDLIFSGSVRSVVNARVHRCVNDSQLQTAGIFGVRLPSAIIAERCRIFSTKYEACNNLLHKLSMCPM